MGKLNCNFCAVALLSSLPLLTFEMWVQSPYAIWMNIADKAITYLIPWADPGFQEDG